MGRIIHTVRIEHADVRLDWMLGRAIIEVSLMKPSPWRFRFSDSEGITVECLWRIISRGQLTRTSSDHGHQFGLPAPVDAAAEATEAIVGRTVSDVYLRPETGDLQLRFEGDLALEIIPDFTGYEAWQVYGLGGVCYTVHG
ncbi:MAG: hypothetical protein ABR611_15730, partial [Chthoniobacterales bacterium]